MTTKHYHMLFFLFALGLSCLAYGAMHGPEPTLGELTSHSHAHVAKGVGLIVVLLGIDIALILYRSLPLRTNTERPQQAADEARNVISQANEEQMSIRQKPRESKRRSPSLKLIWGRTSRDSEVLVAREKKQQKTAQSHWATKHHRRKKRLNGYS